MLHPEVDEIFDEDIEAAADYYDRFIHPFVDKSTAFKNISPDVMRGLLIRTLEQLSNVVQNGIDNSKEFSDDSYSQEVYRATYYKMCIENIVDDLKGFR
jgi:hypothetical protein